MKIILPTLLLFTFYLLLVTPVFALEDIGYSRIHPASPLYFLKGVREKLELHFAQTYRVKVFRQLEFATRRLRESRTLLATDQELIQPTLERYIAHLNSFSDRHQQEDFSKIQDNLGFHVKVLQQIYDAASNLKAKMAIRSAMNRIIQRADVPNDAKALVCDLFLKEASSSALNQTEQMVLLERGRKCLEIKK